MAGTGGHRPDPTLILQDAAASSTQGSRPSQLDRYSIFRPDDFPDDIGQSLLALFVLCDGHASREVGGHAKYNLPRLLLQSKDLRRGDYDQAIQSAIKHEERLLFEEFVNGKQSHFYAGSTLAISRGEIPDAPGLQDGLLSSEPFITRMTLAEHGAYILALTSDGVTDQLEDSEILNRLSDSWGADPRAQRAARILVSEVGHRPRSGNATCIAVFMKGHRCIRPSEEARQMLDRLGANESPSDPDDRGKFTIESADELTLDQGLHEVDKDEARTSRGDKPV
ncbi:hypothetical protein N8T08_010921 [Aspergillus melleus]|uniref:Uncharacterized protein n=1 Tax=Aspergillus melleus TaxID=138277 RepID=A0ACC3AR38_9EURO|nr:hypothetical protein N8T08_010921 [Aspergillus melleus]